MPIGQSSPESRRFVRRLPGTRLRQRRRLQVHSKCTAALPAGSLELLRMSCGLGQVEALRRPGAHGGHGAPPGPQLDRKPGPARPDLSSRGALLVWPRYPELGGARAHALPCAASKVQGASSWGAEDIPSSWHTITALWRSTSRWELLPHYCQALTASVRSRGVRFELWL